MQNNWDIRCGQCRRKLAECTYVHIAIKCPRCGTINHLQAQSHLSRASERPTEKKDEHAQIFTHSISA